MRGKQIAVLTLWKDNVKIDIPIGNSEKKAKRGRNLALFTQMNWTGLAIYAVNSREYNQMISSIKNYIMQGYRPKDDDIQAKQLLMDLRIAY